MIGIYVDSCAEESQFPCIEEAKELGLKPVVFVNELSRIRDTSIPIIHAHDIWKFNGTVVATCAVTADLLKDIPSPLYKFTLCDDVDIEGIKHISSISEIAVE